MKLCIAEKPSVAREIAEVIGAKEKKIGYYEGNGYQVTWTFGHFCTLKEPHEYKPSWKPWNLSYLPILPPAYEIKLIDNKGVVIGKNLRGNDLEEKIKFALSQNN